MSAKTIFVIECGEYSDYRVVGVFTSRENAERVADKLNAPDEWGYSDRATVAEWPLDPAIANLNRGFSPWTVSMDRDGNVVSCETDRVSAYNLCDSAADACLYNQRNSGSKILRGTIWARDSRGAVKALNDRRLALIANGEWQ